MTDMRDVIHFIAGVSFTLGATALAVLILWIAFESNWKAEGR